MTPEAKLLALSIFINILLGAALALTLYRINQWGKEQDEFTYRCVTCSHQYNQSQLTPNPRQPTGDHWICTKCGGMVLLETTVDEPKCINCEHPLEWTPCTTCHGLGRLLITSAARLEPNQPTSRLICPVCAGHRGTWTCPQAATQRHDGLTPKPNQSE